MDDQAYLKCIQNQTHNQQNEGQLQKLGYLFFQSYRTNIPYEEQNNWNTNIQNLNNKQIELIEENFSVDGSSNEYFIPKDVYPILFNNTGFSTYNVFGFTTEHSYALYNFLDVSVLASLFIEDSEDLRGIFLEFFKINKFDVYFAIDGQDGIEKAKTVIPDLIVLDIMMPKKDGYHVCEYFIFYAGFFN